MFMLFLLHKLLAALFVEKAWLENKPPAVSQPGKEFAPLWQSGLRSNGRVAEPVSKQAWACGLNPFGITQWTWFSDLNKYIYVILDTLEYFVWPPATVPAACESPPLRFLEYLETRYGSSIGQEWLASGNWAFPGCGFTLLYIQL